MKNKRILAFDFGASSGRAMLGTLENGKLEIKEIHRFANDPVNIGERYYWDVLRLFHEIKQGIVLANQNGGFDSIGIDTWGVDFGIIDKNGELLSNPAHYRDSRTIGIPEEVSKIIPEDELYKCTGIQKNNFNTVYQLYYLSKYCPETLKNADKILLMPDLFAYFLTGEKRMEYTIASTTGLLNAETKQIDIELTKKLGINPEIFADMIMPGESYGNLSKEICEELHCESVPVFAVGTHDTASAVASVPSLEKDYAYISCGTWSLFGTVSDTPINTAEANKIGFTNEGTTDNRTRFLRNIMGLWLIQQSRGEWKRRGLNVSFDEMENSAKAAEGFVSFINPDDLIFNPPGDMPSRVVEFCKRTNQPIPNDMGEILRCIYQSLALKYKQSLIGLEKITGTKYSKLHMVGGGIKDKLLCQMAANACNIPVVAGPVEATVTGNVLVQFMAFGVIKDLTELKKIVLNGTPVQEFTPEKPEEWDKAYKKFLEYNM